MVDEDKEPRNRMVGCWSSIMKIRTPIRLGFSSLCFCFDLGGRQRMVRLNASMLVTKVGTRFNRDAT